MIMHKSNVSKCIAFADSVNYLCPRCGKVLRSGIARYKCTVETSDTADGNEVRARPIMIDTKVRGVEDALLVTCQSCYPAVEMIPVSKDLLHVVQYIYEAGLNVTEATATSRFRRCNTRKDSCSKPVRRSDLEYRYRFHIVIRIKSSATLRGITKTIDTVDLKDLLNDAAIKFSHKLVPDPDDEYMLLELNMSARVINCGDHTAPTPYDSEFRKVYLNKYADVVKTIIDAYLAQTNEVTENP